MATKNPDHLLGPSPDAYGSKRILDCRKDLQPIFLALIDKAIGAGWSKTDVITALTELAHTFLLEQTANEQAERALEARHLPQR